MTDVTHHAFHAEHGFSHLKLGRNPVRHDARTLRLARYLDDAVVLPTLPPSCDLTAAVPSWPMYDNDRLGDCTWAAAAHMVQAWTAANGSVYTPDPSLVDLAYWQTGQPPSTTGTPGGPTDTGRVELDVLNYWRQHGFGGAPDRSAPITAYVAVDPRNTEHVRASIYLFGGCYLGVALPITAQRQRVWDVVGDPATDPDSAPGSWGGHAVPELAYDSAGNLKVITWGAPLQMTQAFHDTYVDEAYAIIAPDWLPSGKTPQGFDLAALQADLAALAVFAAS